MTQPMKRLDDDPCVKCGCLGPSLKWEAPRDAPEVMTCTCWKCGFIWYRSPLDTPDPALDLSRALKTP